MFREHGFMLFSVFFTTVFAAISTATAQDDDKPAAERDADGQRNWTKVVAASVDDFAIYPDDRAKEPVEVVEAYQWANPGRPQVRGERLCLLYLHNGRPIASCKIYPTGRSIVHAFVSMTDDPIVCRQGDRSVWTPASGGIEFRSLAGTAAPHDSAARRRIEMKAIARQFTAETGTVEADRQKALPELRLLPTPLYRYEPPENDGDGVIDGAVFCFVVGGGNPQVFLLLEAVRRKGQTSWRYGFSRRTNAELKAFHRLEQVWTVPAVSMNDFGTASDFHKIWTPVARSQ